MKQSITIHARYSFEKRVVEAAEAASAAINSHGFSVRSDELHSTILRDERNRVLKAFDEFLRQTEHAENWSTRIRDTSDLP